MNKIVEELKKVSVFYIATEEGSQPRVRPFGTIAEVEGEAYICCGNFKAVYKQISQNPKVELCGMYDATSWLRVAATLVEDSRLEIQEAVLADPTGPKGLYVPGDGRLATFKLTEVKAFKYSFFAPPEEVK